LLAFAYIKLTRRKYSLAVMKPADSLTTGLIPKAPQKENKRCFKIFLSILFALILLGCYFDPDFEKNAAVEELPFDTAEETAVRAVEIDHQSALGSQVKSEAIVKDISAENEDDRPRAGKKSKIKKSRGESSRLYGCASFKKSKKCMKKNTCQWKDGKCRKKMCEDYTEENCGKHSKKCHWSLKSLNGWQPRCSAKCELFSGKMHKEKCVAAPRCIYKGDKHHTCVTESCGDLSNEMNCGTKTACRWQKDKCYDREIKDINPSHTQQHHCKYNDPKIIIDQKICESEFGTECYFSESSRCLLKCSLLSKEQCETRSDCTSISKKDFAKTKHQCEKTPDVQDGTAT